MNALSRFARLAAICAVFSSCASLSSYQEARVLPQGEGRLALAVTGYSDDLKRAVFDDSADGNDFRLLEVSGRAGVWDNLEVGVKYTFLGAVAADVKYQLLGRDSGSAFQLSTGFKGGYASLEVKDSSGNGSTAIPVVDLIVPVYLGWTPNSWLGVAVAPEFCYRISDNTWEYPSGPIAGANVDLRLGKKAGIVLEYGYHRHLDKDYALQNFGASVYAPFEIHSLLGALSL